MHKSEFTDYIAAKHKITKVEAERIINIFSDSITSALAEKNDVNITGFGKFYPQKVEARTGRNPQTGKPIQIAAYVHPKFSCGSKLKEACNKK
ncbi:MAG: HU family DNA-binding protein [Rickettsiaceae bacterium]|nr:HU family DNA-binding protein [Rickettsiaceae bacterium]